MAPLDLPYNPPVTETIIEGNSLIVIKNYVWNDIPYMINTIIILLLFSSFAYRVNVLKTITEFVCKSIGWS